MGIYTGVSSHRGTTKVHRYRQALREADKDNKTVLNYIFVGLGFAISALFLTRNLYPIISTTPHQRAKLLLILVIVLHFGLAVAIKFLFFAYVFSPCLPLYCLRFLATPWLLSTGNFSYNFGTRRALHTVYAYANDGRNWVDTTPPPLNPATPALRPHLATPKPGKERARETTWTRTARGRRRLRGLR